MNEFQQYPIPQEAEETRGITAEEINAIVDRIRNGSDDVPEADETELFGTDAEIRGMLNSAIQEQVKEMEPEERRLFCADWARQISEDDIRRTGKLFAALAASGGRREPDCRELGKRIMEERNPNYKPKLK